MQPETMIPARLWLWTAVLTHMDRQVVPGQPIRPCRHECIDGTYMAIYDLGLPEGAVVVATAAGLPEHLGTAYVVLGETLQHVHHYEAQDIIDPDGATERLHKRLLKEARLDVVSKRVRFPDGHALTSGAFVRWGGWWAVVGEVTPRQAWLRGATTEEILAAGEVLPVAPVGADLLAAIRAEVAEAEAEATTPAAA